MCGNAGIVSLNQSPVFEADIRTMCSVISHRGPDGEGVHIGDGVGLGMRRLSIIDLASGQQPIYNEDRTISVVFNGEIYNFQELRERLESRGHLFSSRTDTEVLVHLYEEHGKRCVEHLRGMFGFALWDERRQVFLLARDRLGIKPVYYGVFDGRLLFASEVKSILALNEVERRLNFSAVAHLFTFLTTPPTEGIIHGVRKLEPGHILTVSGRRAPIVEKYWDIQCEPDHGKSETYFVERLRELLNESVRLHMVSDVPLGAFLSGGIDSSSVTAIAAGLASEPLKTFSIRFSEPEYNELDYARIVSRRHGTDHHELTLGSGALDSLDDLVWNLDEPLGDSSAIPTYMVSKLAARSVKVVLSGDGGDELFAGYDKYLTAGRERSSRMPEFARPILAAVGRAMPDGMRGRNYVRHASLVGAERYLESSTLFRRDALQELFEPDFAEHLRPYEPWRPKAAYLNSNQGHWLSGLQALDIRNYLPLDILTKVDRMSMAHSIEARVPLLDHKVVEFAATIPAELSLRRGATKYILKQAMRGLLPNEIINRPKRGFAIPLGHWFRESTGSNVRDVLLGDRTRRRGFFRMRTIENLLARHEKGRDLDLHIWSLMCFELWSRRFLDTNVLAKECAAA